MILDLFIMDQFKHVFWVLKRTISWDGSFEYPQHMFWLRNKKNNFQSRGQSVSGDILLYICMWIEKLIIHLECGHYLFLIKKPQLSQLCAKAQQGGLAFISHIQ